jgi:hypothetical protein
MYEQIMNICKIGLCNSGRDGPPSSIRDGVDYGNMACDWL